MKSLSAALVATLTLGSGLAHAQYADAQDPSGQATEEPAAQPPTAAPAETPPAPPAELPQPPLQQFEQAAPAPTETAPQTYEAAPQPMPQAAEPAPAQGQWVYTQQYGWVWMPYGSQYTYTPTQTGVYPSEYVYYPSYGWTWVVAPWVFGWGTTPYFGVYGASHFGWYHHATFGGWRGGYHPAYGARVYNPGYRSPAPAYGGYHPGYVPPRAGFGAPVRTYSRAPAFGTHPVFQGHAGGLGSGHAGFGGAHFGGGFHAAFGGGHSSGGFHGGGFHGGHR